MSPETPIVTIQRYHIVAYRSSTSRVDPADGRTYKASRFHCEVFPVEGGDPCHVTDEQTTQALASNAARDWISERGGVVVGSPRVMGSVEELTVPPANDGPALSAADRLDLLSLLDPFVERRAVELREKLREMKPLTCMSILDVNVCLAHAMNFQEAAKEREFWVKAKELGYDA